MEGEEDGEVNGDDVGTSVLDNNSNELNEDEILVGLKLTIP